MGTDIEKSIFFKARKKIKKLKSFWFRDCHIVLQKLESGEYFRVAVYMVSVATTQVGCWSTRTDADK